MNKLHLRIREARDLTGLTQQTLADELGVTRAAVAHWESATGSAPT
ncbi:helix-turn-helix transcriptional regulator, partial [Xanthomonas sp. Kuri4-1]